MKKILKLFIAGAMILSLVGCGVNSKGEDNNSTIDNENINKVEEAKEQPPVTIEELPVDITILEPNSIGTIYMEATFTNNSKYAIKGFSIEALLKDTNEKTYLSNYDTVMPGETSPKFDSFGPSTGNADDIEVLEYEINVIDEAGEVIYLTYDTKLNTYKWH